MSRKQYPKEKEGKQKRILELKSLGICVVCGKNPKYSNNHTRCADCNKKHHEERIIRENKYRDMAFEAYGGAICKCCGEDIKEFLTFDHMGGNGTIHRKEEIKGKKIAYWLKINNYPPGFQVLCMNCNWGKYINNGICPHKINETVVADSEHCRSENANSANEGLVERVVSDPSLHMDV